MKTVTVTALLLVALVPMASAQTPSPASTSATPAPRAVGTSGTSGTSATSTATDYRLAAGDKLRIEVYKDNQLSQSLQIRPDGKITLPLVGDVAAAGRTSVELRDAIGAALNAYITNPVVTVIVVETTPQVVFVTGEVNKPGPVPLVNGRISVLQALAVAGGFTDFANKKDIRILRKGSAGMQTLKFNYKDALDGDSLREPPALQAGDTVIVK